MVTSTLLSYERMTSGTNKGRSHMESLVSPKSNFDGEVRVKM